jgi:hypothetical protein
VFTARYGLDFEIHSILSACFNPGLIIFRTKFSIKNSRAKCGSVMKQTVDLS